MKNINKNGQAPFFIAIFAVVIIGAIFLFFFIRGTTLTKEKAAEVKLEKRQEAAPVVLKGLDSNFLKVFEKDKFKRLRKEIVPNADFTLGNRDPFKPLTENPL